MSSLEKDRKMKKRITLDDIRYFEHVKDDKIKTGSKSFHQNIGMMKEQIIDHLTLSPIEMWVKHHIKPSQMILKMFLVIMLSFQTLSTSIHFNKYQRSQIELFQEYLYDQSDLNVIHFKTLQQFQEHLQDLQKICESRQKVYFQNFNCSAVHSYIEVQKFDLNHDYQIQSKLDLNRSINLQLNLTNLVNYKTFFQQVKRLTIFINNLRLIIQDSGSSDQIFNCWDIEINYENNNYATLETYSQYKKVPCDDSSFHSHDLDPSYQNKLDIFHGQHNVSYNILIIILAVASQLLNMKFIKDTINFYISFRIIYETQNNTQYRMNDILISKDTKSIKSNTSAPNNNSGQLLKKQEKQKKKDITDLIESTTPWSQLDFKQKMIFFDRWLIINIISNIIYIFTSLIQLIALVIGHHDQSQGRSQFLVGLSAFLAWINILKYIGYLPSINKVFTILQQSIPYVLRFLVGLIPIFFGYVFIGMCLFSKYECFDSTSRSMVTLLSLMMADDLYGFITSLQGEGILGILFIMSYTAVSFMIVHSIIVAIIVNKTESSLKQEQMKQKDKNTSKDKQTIKQQQLIISKLKLQNSINVITTIKQLQTQTPLRKYNTQDYNQSHSLNPFINSSAKSIHDDIHKQLIDRYSRFYDKQAIYNNVNLDFHQDTEYMLKKSSMIDKIDKQQEELNKLIDKFSEIQLDDVEYFDLNYEQKVGLVERYQKYLKHLETRIYDMRLRIKQKLQ